MRVKAKIERYEKDIFLGGESARKFLGQCCYLARKGDISNISLIRYENICCESMRDALQDRFIIFGQVDSFAGNNNPYINIHRTEVYPSGSSDYEMAIKFCPWCCEEIIIDLIPQDEEEDLEK